MPQLHHVQPEPHAIRELLSLCPRLSILHPCRARSSGQQQHLFRLTDIHRQPILERARRVPTRPPRPRTTRIHPYVPRARLHVHVNLLTIYTDAPRYLGLRRRNDNTSQHVSTRDSPLRTSPNAQPLAHHSHPSRTPTSRIARCRRRQCEW
jgi:hypothetical protein